MNQPRLQVTELRPSRRLALILGSAHLGALLLLATLPIAMWLQLCGVALLLPGGVLAIRRHALRRGRGAVTALDFMDREHLRVRTRDGAWHTGSVLGTSTVGAAWTVLNLRLDDRRWPVHVVITGNSIDAEDFRRLRVWLRWGPRHATDAGDAAV
jgi:toxin CptA